MRGFVAVVSFVSRVAGVLAALLLLSAVLSVSHMVFVRYVLNQSTIWQTEYTSYAIVAATFLGAPWTLIVRGHVNVDLLPLAAGRRGRIIMEALSGLASLAFVVLLAYATWFFLYEAWEFSWRSETVWSVPLWMPVAPVVAGTVWLAVQYVAELVRLCLDGPSIGGGAHGVSRTELFDEITEGSAR
ncbi:TRAP transporter small permease subunit [Amorphus coralli]|uniref:TRAP transporter small permease subunit n=1 Tax=Amorphus coralli TaxID=340680 RepID=UPI00036291CA|nr:TRAP transporter small permease [Amorphus coralli]